MNSRRRISYPRGNAQLLTAEIGPSRKSGDVRSGAAVQPRPVQVSNLMSTGPSQPWRHEDTAPANILAGMHVSEPDSVQQSSRCTPKAQSTSPFHKRERTPSLQDETVRSFKPFTPMPRDAVHNVYNADDPTSLKVCWV